MALVIEDEYLPATLTARPMLDEEFAELRAKYPDHFIEMTAEGELVIKPPNTHSLLCRAARFSVNSATGLVPTTGDW